MRKVFIIAALLFGLLSGDFVMAQQKKPVKPVPSTRAHAVRKNNARQNKVAVFINTTNDVIKEAEKALNTNNIRIGAFSRSAKLQKEAIHLFKKGDINAAMEKSYQARMLSLIVIRQNRIASKPEWQPTDMEISILENLPNEQELKNEITSEDIKTEQEKLEVPELKELESVPVQDVDPKQ